MPKIQIFDDLMEGFQDAIALKKGRRAGIHRGNRNSDPARRDLGSRLRITEIPRIKPMKPREIREIRIALGASQSVFAHVLNVSPKVVQSREHGARRPTSAALKLLSIARTNPQILLQPATTSPRPRRRAADF